MATGIFPDKFAFAMKLARKSMAQKIVKCAKFAHLIGTSPPLATGCARCRLGTRATVPPPGMRQNTFACFAISIPAAKGKAIGGWRLRNQARPEQMA
jgi:hypothetical protein